MSKSHKDNSVSIRFLARELKTSTCTVSRVLNGKGTAYRIPDATQERIREYANKVNYRPNAAAQALRLNRMRDIGLILPDCSNPFFAHLEKSVVDEAYRRHYSVSIVNTSDNTSNEAGALSRLLHRRVEGIVISPVGIEAHHLRDLPDDAPPIVLVDRWFSGVDLPQVALDNVSAAKMATDYLLDHGHRRIACVRGNFHTAPSDDRVVGYNQALKSHGIAVNESLIVGDEFSQKSRFEGVMQILKSEQFPSAILSLGNQNTLGALRALREVGLRVPEDISIVSFDDIEGKDVWAYLKDVLDRLLAGETDYHQLRPDIWRESHPEAIRQYRIQERRYKAERKQTRRAARQRFATA